MTTSYQNAICKGIDPEGVFLMANTNKKDTDTVNGVPVEKWVSLDFIADYTGVSKDSLRNWIKQGAVPCYRIGKQYKFKVSEIDEWVRSGKSAEVEP
jgi:excisionase family DNA binding protein